MPAVKSLEKQAYASESTMPEEEIPVEEEPIPEEE